MENCDKNPNNAIVSCLKHKCPFRLGLHCTLSHTIDVTLWCWMQPALETFYSTRRHSMHEVKTTQRTDITPHNTWKGFCWGGGGDNTKVDVENTTAWEHENIHYHSYMYASQSRQWSVLYNDLCWARHKMVFKGTDPQQHTSRTWGCALNSPIYTHVIIPHTFLDVWEVVCHYAFKIINRLIHLMLTWFTPDHHHPQKLCPLHRISVTP